MVRTLFKYFVLIMLASNGWSAAAHETLVVGVGKLPQASDIAFSGYAYEMAMMRPLHRGLVRADKDGFLSSDLATRWEFSQDRKRYSFCTPRFRFHNGKEVTLEDLQYSFARLWDAQRMATEFWIYSRLRPEIAPYSGSHPNFKHGDEICFDVRLKIPYSGFLTLITSPFFSLVSKPDGDQPSSPAGRFCQNTVNAQRIEYVECASSDAPRRIVLQAVPDDRTAARLIAAGKMDLYLGITDLGGKKLPDLLAKGCKATYLNDLGTAGFFFNTTLPMFKDREFRADFTLMAQEIIRRNRKSLSPALA